MGDAVNEDAVGSLEGAGFETLEEYDTLPVSLSALYVLLR